ncbi:DUF4012 domain-containing protein [Mycobacterium sp. Y57]|uniref:DUF4012 domain-containing protein n=1 Tax=Mycolicibacterium xanthum TaxID=2796469 RepID=UPI001C85D53E|nr:DUF4012 domain-containing protein [Mycolicibacterium xanthum]MBX7435249.1 DUF4012 domain-containing protein [Mycolicibacterium xanthum]
MSRFSRRPSSDDNGDDDSYDLQVSDDDEQAGWFRRQLHGRRAVLWGSFLALLVVVLALGGWLWVKAGDAKANLEQAREYAQQTKDTLLEGNSEEASRLADNARDSAQAARDATHSLPWNIAAALPWLGSPFKAGQQISDVVLGLADDVLQPTADVGVTISPDQLYKDGRVDVQLLRQQEPQLAEISANAVKLDAQAQEIADPGYLTVLRDARSQLQSQTSGIAGVIENTALAARLAPTMMGADGPRSYFMAFQTNAEARGTGGLLGGFGILRFDNGVPTVEDLGKNTELAGASAAVDLPSEFNDTYGASNPTTDFRNSNSSSHFPYAAQIWKSMWAGKTGMNVDGVLAIDPIALSYILQAVGPVTMADGEKITADNVVELTESTAYARFPDDQNARKNYLQGIAIEVVKKVTGKIDSPNKLLDALGKAVGEGRIAVWSSFPDDQALLEQTRLGHAVPDDAAPYAGVVVNNLAGNKMDYYLEREIEYIADDCSGDTRISTVTVRLKNTASLDANLTEYVGGMVGLPRGAPFEVPNGTMITSVRLLATKNATLLSALANGERVPVIKKQERGHPSFEVQVLIPPGKSGELTFRMSEPTSAGSPRVPVQPLVDDVKPVVSVPECSE